METDSSSPSSGGGGSDATAAVGSNAAEAPQKASAPAASAQKRQGSGPGRAATATADYQAFLRKCKTAQVLGFDVMLDAAGKMHLVEVNNSPSLSTEEIVPAPALA